MGKLVERQIPTMFGGVSRQPNAVRRPNQMQEHTNALSSVVTGGFEKRPGTQMISALTGIDVTKDYAVHDIDRDATEQTFVLLTEGSILAYNAITGAAKTVTIGDTKHYHVVEADTLTATGVLEIGAVDFEEQLAFDSSETTFDWGWQLSDAVTGRFRVEGSADGVTWNTISAASIGGAASGTFSTTIDAVATGDHNYIRVWITVGMATAADTLTLWATFKDLTYLLGVAGPEDFAFVSVADFTFIANKTVTVRMAEAASGTVTDTARSTVVGTPPAGIPAPSGSGNIYKIIEDDNLFTAYFVADDATENLYVETVDPNAHNTFDGSTMPHQLVRNADGTFTYSEAAWAAREVGDEELTENPAFVGKTINDVNFFRNRLAFLADEDTYLSRSAKALNMWPEKAVETLDTDPIHRAATTDDVNLLRFATVFRKILFVTSDRSQFELSSLDKFTPGTAAFDQATTYPASPIAAPESMGDVLFFGSSAPAHAVVYEYFFDDTSLGNTAADITKHIVDYIPTDILKIATDPTTGTMFLLSTGAQNKVFVYRTFFDGDTKVQSSWGEYTFGAAEANALIHGMAVFSGFLVLVIERDDGNVYLEQMPIEREAADATLGYIPLVDQRELLTGVHDATNDCTTFTPTWDHNDDCEVILGPNFSEPGRRLTLIYPDEYTLTLATVLAGEVITINTLDFTAHATTTTTANREFSISGNDIADAGELTTCINDATDGVPGVTATDNGDGTVSLNVDDACDGTIAAPTGTAITNATITAVEVNNKIAARGDFDTNQSYVGRQYTKTVELSKLFMREDNDSPAILNGRLQVRDITFRHVDSGYFKVVVTPSKRDAKTFEMTGRILGDSENQIGLAAIAAGQSFRAMVNSNGETVKIEVINDSPFPSVITAAAWRGFFNEIARQG